MPTSSFDKSFWVSNTVEIEKIRQALAHPRLIQIRGRDYKAENAKGLELLKQRLVSVQSKG